MSFFPADDALKKAEFLSWLKAGSSRRNGVSYTLVFCDEGWASDAAELCTKEGLRVETWVDGKAHAVKVTW